MKLTLILSTKTQRERLKYDKINCLFLSFQYRVYLLCQFYFTAIEQNVQQACETMIKGNFLFILVSPPILGVFNAVMLRGPTTLKRLSFHIVSKLWYSAFCLFSSFQKHLKVAEDVIKDRPWYRLCQLLDIFFFIKDEKEVQIVFNDTNVQIKRSSDGLSHIGSQKGIRAYRILWHEKFNSNI